MLMENRDIKELQRILNSHLLKRSTLMSEVNELDKFIMHYIKKIREKEEKE